MFFIGIYIGAPIFLIINLYTIFKRKKYLNIAGENILLDNRKKMPKWIMLGITIVTIIWIIKFIEANHWITVFGIAFWLTFYTIFVINKLYKNINGIYENGIIFNKYFSWNEIQSYNMINEGSIFFILKEGDGIIFDNILNMEKVIEITNINGINKVDEKN